MKINPNSSIELDEGERFIEERQDADNIWRTIKLELKSGAVVQVKRHFSQIGPTITKPDGSNLDTHVVYEIEGDKQIPVVREFVKI